MVRFALLQAVGVGAFGYLRGFAVVLCVADVTLIAFPALLALSTMCGRRARTVAATFSLMMASVTIVDFAGGVTEAHFHFFVMVGVVALYQDWTAFGVCILITVADHAVMGVLLPDDVYGTPAEQPTRSSGPSSTAASCSLWRSRRCSRGTTPRSSHSPTRSPASPTGAPSPNASPGSPVWRPTLDGPDRRPRLLQEHQ